MHMRVTMHAHNRHALVLHAVVPSCVTILQGMRAGLKGTMRIKGLLEMMFEVLSDWIDAFIEDIEEAGAGETGGSTTPKGSISPRDSRGAA